MKRIIAIKATAVALTATVALTSCKKEPIIANENDTHDTVVVVTDTLFTGVMESCQDLRGKTTLDGSTGILSWTAADEVRIYGSTGYGIYGVEPQTSPTSAVFVRNEGNPGRAPYYAVYPAGRATGNSQIALPAVQQSSDGLPVDFPMYATSNSTSLAFKNLCGLLKLSLQKSNTTVTSITLTVNTEINGTFDISYSGSVPVLEYVAGGSCTTKLECVHNISNVTDFYIYLPQGQYSSLRLEIADNAGNVCTKVSNGTVVTVERNKYTTITLGGNDMTFLPEGALSGLFSVSATQQVRFSRGNLQYQASSGTMRFAPHQYDVIGNANSAISATYSGWIDLFGWGTGDNPYLKTTRANDYQDFVDWGDNPISNGGGQAGTWRTMSIDEWTYLINRSEGQLYGTGNIEGVGGVIILPDNWTLPSSGHFNPGCPLVGRQWSRNEYSYSEWAAMEVAGALFLPATGYRQGSIVEEVNVNGCYWSTSVFDRIGRWVLFSCEEEVATDGGDDCYIGHSVRLVQNN